QGKHRGARGLFAAALDQIGHRLGLGEVELAVEERPLGKLAGPRQPRPDLDHAPQQQVHHYGATVALQFQDIFAGKGVGRLEEQRKPLVDHATVRAAKRAVDGYARRRQAAYDLRGNVPDPRPGDAHNTYAAAAW